jgi:hypothetical protein
VIHGGDMIDITNVAAKLSDSSLDDVFRVLRQYPYLNDVHMLIGNHELYNHKRAVIFNRYGRGYLSQAKLSTEITPTTTATTTTNNNTSTASTTVETKATPSVTPSTSSSSGSNPHETKEQLTGRWRDAHTMYYEFTPHPHVRCIVLVCTHFISFIFISSIISYHVICRSYKVCHTRSPSVNGIRNIARSHP